MPELPDVEVYRQYLDATALHQKVEGVHAQSPELIEGTTSQGLGRALQGNTLEATARHGKYLFVDITGSSWLILHFGMTGNLKYYQHSQDKPEYTRFLVSFANGYHLAYIAPRKLGRIALTDSPQAWVSEKGLGPDALAISESAFLERTAHRRGSVKSWLMHQKNIAGIGNVYSDEILFQARINPKTAVNELKEGQLKELYQVMRTVLEDAITARADPDQMPRSFLTPHRHKGGKCPNCNGTLKTIKVSGRTAWYCPGCQGG